MCARNPAGHPAGFLALRLFDFRSFGKIVFRDVAQRRIFRSLHAGARAADIFRAVAVGSFHVSVDPVKIHGVERVSFPQCTFVIFRVDDERRFAVRHRDARFYGGNAGCSFSCCPSLDKFREYDILFDVVNVGA